MTTDEMRKFSLDNFDRAAATLRAVVADPSLNNDMYPPLKDAMKEVQYAINRILRVNGAIEECSRCKTPT